MALLIFLLFLGFILAVLIGFYSAYMSGRGALSYLAHLKCPKCAKPFGTEGAMSAEQAFIRQTEELRKDNKAIRFVIVASWPLACRNCEWRGSFEPAKKELLAENVVVG